MENTTFLLVITVIPLASPPLKISQRQEMLICPKAIDEMNVIMTLVDVHLLVRVLFCVIFTAWHVTAAFLGVLTFHVTVSKHNHTIVK